MSDESSEPSSADGDPAPDRDGTPPDPTGVPSDGADGTAGEEAEPADGGFEFDGELAGPAPERDADDADESVGEREVEPGEGADVDEPEPTGLIGAMRRKAPYPETTRAVLWSLLAMTVASLVMRFVGLGARVAHQDEGRVGYWIVRYLESGVWEYRAIVHGPFLFHANKWVFDVLGPSDFTARLAVAVIGGLLPLVAWLFREHLRDTEVVALGLLLALNPVLVYYSRFMRNDVPLAAFMLLAVGFAVRYYDTRNYRHVFGAVGAFALGMTTKENGLLYAACWLGAAALLLDHRLFAASHVADDRGPVGTFFAYVAWVLPVNVRRVPGAVRDVLNLDAAERDGGVRETAGDTRRWVAVNWKAIGVSVAAVVEFVAIIVFFYAPRGGGYLKPGGGGPPSAADDTTGPMGLYSSLGDLGRGDPSQFVAVVEEATVGSWQEFTSVWGGHEHSYLSFAKHYVEVMIAGALVVSAFALVGFLVDRYGDGGPRDLVALCGYWGFVSVVGYPIATDIRAGWATTHAIVPLAIPAAVGLAILFRWAVTSYTLEDGVGLLLAALLLLTVFGQMGLAVTDQVYQNPQSPNNEIVQYAQPSTDTKPTLARVERIGRERGGPGDVDAMYWGDNFAIADESGLNQPPAPGPYYGRRTWMWYMEMYQYNANESGEHFVYGDTDNETVLNETKPPVVITLGKNGGERVPKDGGAELHEWLVDNGYERVSHQRYGDENDSEVSRPILFYIRTDPDESTGEGPLSGPLADPVRGVSVDATGDWSVAESANGGGVAPAWLERTGGEAPVVGSTALNTSESYLAGNEQRGALCRRTAVDGARLQRGPVA